MVIVRWWKLNGRKINYSFYQTLGIPIKKKKLKKWFVYKNELFFVSRNLEFICEFLKIDLKSGK